MVHEVNVHLVVVVRHEDHHQVQQASRQRLIIHTITDSDKKYEEIPSYTISNARRRRGTPMTHLSEANVVNT